MVIVKRLLCILALLLGVMVLLCSVAIWFLFTPETVTPQVVGILQQYTKSDVSIKSVDLSLFTRFPNLTLKIDSLRITQTKDSIDDLIFARECRLAIDPFELIRNKNVAINFLALRGTKIYMYVDSLHGPLKTFILPEAKEQNEADTLNTIDMSQYRLSLRRLKIDSANIIINDRVKDFYTRVENWSTDMSMDISSTVSKVDVNTGFSNLIVWQKGELFVKRTSMDFQSEMLFDRVAEQITFDNAKMHINDIALKSDGMLHRDTLNKGIYMEIKSSLNTPSIAEFLELIPSSVIDKKDKITTEGKVLFDMELKGLYSDSSYPTIDAKLKIDNAKAKYESRKLELERVDCDTYAHINLNTPEESYADIKSLHINTSEIIDLTISGKVSNIFKDSDADIKILSEINFDRFTEIFPLNEGMICKGTNSSDINAMFKVSDLKNRNYAKIFIDGQSTFNNLDLTYNASKFFKDTTNLTTLHLFTEKGLMLFGDKIVSENNSRTLRAKMNFQDVSYRSKSGEELSIKDVAFTVGANFDLDSSNMNGVGIRGVAKNTNVSIDSLLKANLEKADITIIVKSKNEDRNGEIITNINSQQISVKEYNYDSDITLSTVDMSITAGRVDETKKGGKIDFKVNSHEISVFEPAYNSRFNLSSAEIDLSTTKQGDEERTLSGNIAFSNFGISSDIFPMDMILKQTSISIRDKHIYLDNAHLKLGDSEMTATGSIENILKKLFVDPRLMISGELAIDSPRLDFGAIVEASNHSVMMMEQEEQGEQEVSDSLQMNKIDSTSMFLVPHRMNFAFKMNVDKALFWGTEVENLSGLATLNNGVLSLDKIELNAIGAKALGSVIYRNIDRESSNLAGYLMLQRVDINRIGELLPSIHTMLPMIESFEGVVDFSVNGNTNLDNQSQIVIPTLNSAMHFKGKNLVVMDGETFTEISKKMMFKNKERNLIDSLEVYALASESRVDVLPFSISIDRYSAIVGGTQLFDPETFDLDYNYHVSVMKSPLPFKAGIDISGNLDNFDYKVTKAKLKKTNFDEQHNIYINYCRSIKETYDALTSDIERRREKMRAMRRQQIEEDKKREQEVDEE